ncbi:MAG: alpha/beta hydrolase [Firmicutes bacterium]|nr:alpha/beta hydrolase [Bacillota bacterium]
MPRIKIKEGSYFYAGDAAGKQPPLLFCHGSGGSHRHWLYQLNGLKEQAATVAVDLPGHGASEGEPATEISRYRDFLRDFSAALGLKKFVLAGHSMGGATALDYALHYGDDLSGLILVGSGARLRVAPAFLQALHAGSVPPELIEFAYSPGVSPELLESARQEMAVIPPETYLADFTACDRFDCMERLTEINLPVLLICGSADRLTPLKYSRYLQDHLPQAELVEVKGAGHMVMLEAPQKVNRAIASFLKKIVGG